MLVNQVETRRQPLLIDSLHLCQNLFASLISRHITEISNIETESAEKSLQFLSQLRPIDESALLGRRIHTGDLKAAKVFRWIGERYIHRADGETGVRKH